MKLKFAMNVLYWQDHSSQFVDFDKISSSVSMWESIMSNDVTMEELQWDAYHSALIDIFLGSLTFNVSSNMRDGECT